MPASYALTRSLPTSMVRGMLSLSSTAKSVLPFMSAAAAANQWQMGVIGHREEDQSGHTRRVLKRIGQENMGSDYKAYEADWLLSLEITKPIGISYTGAGAAIKCWCGLFHAMNEAFGSL